METIEEVQRTQSRLDALFKERGVPVVMAQLFAEPRNAICLDLDTEDAVLQAANVVLDTCAVRFVAIDSMADDDPNERATIFVGEVPLAFRYGVDDEAGINDGYETDEEEEKIIDPDIERKVIDLVRKIRDEISSRNDVESDEHVLIEKLAAEALERSEAESLVIDAARPQLWWSPISQEIRRKHQKKFVVDAESIALKVVEADPEVLTMNADAMREIVFDYLMQIDRACATNRKSAQPVMNKIRAMARTRKSSDQLF